MKKLLVLLLLLAGYSSIAQVKPPWNKPNNSYGTVQNRTASDSVSMFPTGCGNPVKLNVVDSSMKRAASYFDSCNHRYWLYDPKLKAWDSVHVGVVSTTGGSGISELGNTGNLCLTRINDSTYAVDTNCVATVLRLNHVRDSLAALITLKVTANSPITGATKTKITYDAKGLVTAGADATTSDIGEGSNLYYTDARARAALSLTTTGTSGAATYNSSTGVFNIPQYSGGGGSGAVDNIDSTFRLSGDTLKPAWWVNIKDPSFGAKLDGVVNEAEDGAATGTAFTSASGIFTANDVGKHILIRGLGTAGADFHTTIAGYTSATSITLTSAPATNGSAKYYAYGTDDTPAWQRALDSLALNGGVIYAPDGISVIAGSLVTSLGGVNPNAQIVIPQRDLNTGRGNPSIKIIGKTPPNADMGVLTEIKPSLKGTILYSFIQGTGVEPAIIGAKNTTNAYGNFTYINTFLENLIFRNASNASGAGPTVGGVNFQYVSRGGIENVNADIDIAPSLSAEPDSLVIGIKMPLIGNDPEHSINKTLVVGYRIGYNVNEHTNINHAQTMACYYSLNINKTHHAIHIKRFLSQWSKYDLCIGTIAINGATNGPAYFNIEQLDVEWRSAGKWFDNVNTILDASNFGRGTVRYHPVAAGVDADYSKFSQSGGSNLYVSRTDRPYYAGGPIGGGIITQGTGYIASALRAEINKGVATTGDTDFADFFLSTKQGGLSKVVGRVAFANPDASISDYRLGQISVSTSPSSFSAGVMSIGVGDGTSGLVNVADLSSSKIELKKETVVYQGFGANISGVSSNTTLDGTHYTVGANATSGNITITLPSAVAGNARRIYNIIKTDNTANTVTISTTAGGNIVLSAQYDGAMVQSDGSTGWYRLGYIGSSGSGVTTMAAVGASPNADGATISGSTLTLQLASASFPGVMGTGTQSFAGNKTWTGTVQNFAQAALFGSSSAYNGSSLGGFINVYATDYPRLYFQNAATGTAQTDGVQIGVNLSGSDQDFYFFQRENAGIRFTTNGSTTRFHIKGDGNIEIKNKITQYNSTAPTDGKLLIGHTANGTFELGNIASADGSIIVTNNAGGIDLSTGVITTYTPTLTNTTNIAASTAYTTKYVRVGDWIHVWGEVDIDATAASTISEMGLSLPITTSIAQTYDLAGTASFEDNTTVQIKGDVSNGRAKWRFTPQTDTNNKYSFHFSFKYVAP